MNEKETRPSASTTLDLLIYRDNFSFQANKRSQSETGRMQ